MKEFLPSYDFLGSVYKGTNSLELEEALDSIIWQTLSPTNVFIVIDGYINNKVDNCLKEFTKKLPLNLIKLESNVGLGLALREGLKKCKSEIILRFDTDDINFKDRAYLQVKEIANSNLDVIGSQIYEFISDPSECIFTKLMPLKHEEIKRQIIFRNPINHPTVAFLKDSILNLDGGYRNCPLYEDYDLWIRAIFNGLRFKNIPKSLVAMRIKNQRSRRRGLSLIKKETILIQTFLDISLILGILFIPIFIVRSLITLLPESIFKSFYSKLLRKKI